MRTEGQIISLILAVAKEDQNIRAVLLNGSRVNAKIKKDPFQDFDIIYLVNKLEYFRKHPEWIDVFGERIILQMPNNMKIDGSDKESEKNEITYLMLFKDRNRIDLKLVPFSEKDNYKDSLSQVLLDKDNHYDDLSAPGDIDYWIKRPTQKEFSDCSNEFWWVSTYVVKGLCRDEPLYAKYMLEGPVRNMFIRLISWHVASNYNFSINLGLGHRFLKDYINHELWMRIRSTYPDADISNIWKSLIEMTAIFHEIGISFSQKHGFNYNLDEAENVRNYIYNLQQDQSNF